MAVAPIETMPIDSRLIHLDVSDLAQFVGALLLVRVGSPMDQSRNLDRRFATLAGGQRENEMSVILPIDGDDRSEYGNASPEVQ